ncbi:hypothetical protein CDAR_389491 [Caerostris darwini]|uniref:Serine/threonine-protein kinase RIO1 n=1 Tax=Caerostris darwini TaxID=1538125 RepID=A0AAV4P6G5_9ARAC|nr:hypothetical protein CDAR_389491 [Caerostris darwini]
MESLEEDVEKMNLTDAEDYCYDDDDCDVYYEEGGHSQPTNAYHYNRQEEIEKTFQPVSALFQKYSNKINVDSYINRQEEEERRINETSRCRVKDKSDRATFENALDRKTCLRIFKLLNQNVISSVEGCISSGKEANVYYAARDDGTSRAIKVYKTSILKFKDRRRYVEGDFRFRHNVSHKNPRKMVQAWAEKEMRNLSRIHSAGILSPKPYILKDNVLVMSLIGKNGIPAPLLKNAELSDSSYCQIYVDCVYLMKRLYYDCKLVHADLSEYNLLYSEGQVYLIDVSQSVEPDHQNAMNFLRKDCDNITSYFKKKGVDVLTVQQLTNFVTDSSVLPKDTFKYMKNAVNTVEENDEESKVNEEVFKQAYIPSRLDEVIDPEREVFTGNKDALYLTVTGMKSALLTKSELEDFKEGSKNLDNESDDSSQSDEDVDESQPKNFTNSRRPRDESPNSKKERKKALKEIRREKQKTKIPKHVKKRKEKIAHQNSKK